MLVGLAGTYVLLRRQYEVAAGLVLSLCTIKFHFLIFLPIVILVQRKWRLAVGLSMGILVLIAVSYIK